MEMISKLANIFRSIMLQTSFELFRRQIPVQTWQEHPHFIDLCKSMIWDIDTHAVQNDPIHVLSESLRQKTLASFLNKYKEKSYLRMMIHLPSPKMSMGGASLFMNWIDALRFLGIETKELGWGCNTSAAISAFRPSVLFTSDHSSYTDQFDWEFIQLYRKYNPLIIMQTASHQHDGNTRNSTRLAKAKRRGVNFFVSFREPEYIQAYFQEWKGFGFEILSIPFSANPLIYYYISVQKKPLDYVFLASNNYEKFGRYKDYLLPIFRRYHGVINGPGWGQDELILSRDYHRFLYALANIGINLHIPISLERVSELNERTYILACCGLFQITDKPKILERVFMPGSIVSADNPSDYLEKFSYYLRHEEERQPFIIKSMECVYNGHTIFHRMDSLIKKILCVYDSYNYN